MSAEPFNAQEKLDTVRREISMRRRVYPRWVEAGRMKQDKADREIAVMESIAADYEAQVHSGKDTLL